MKTYAAIDLLDKILEFKAITTDPLEWNERKLASNPPRHIRYLQINALLKAFTDNKYEKSAIDRINSIFKPRVENPITSFLHGNFITGRASEEYAEVKLIISEFVAKKGWELQERPIANRELLSTFQQLMEFKGLVRQILTFNSRWVEASFVTSKFSIGLTSSIAQKLVGGYEELDAILSLLISPKGATFTEEELIAKFNYPTTNLSELDSEYF